jgi:hypothetical protein
MNQDTTTDTAALKKIAFILAAAVLLLALGVWGLLYGTGNDSARRVTSYLQSGTQVFFDEGSFGKDLYAAKVTAYDSGRQILFGGQTSVRGSTLPDVNETNQYPVVAAAAISFKRGMHYGTYTNEMYQSKITPALILNPGEGDFAVSQGLPVRTVSANVSPYAGENFRLKQASQVHIHAGQSAAMRGSTGCLTIAPEQAQLFFESEIGRMGTVHIKR